MERCTPDEARRIAANIAKLPVIRPARDGDVLPAFRRRCLFAIGANADRSSHRGDTITVHKKRQRLSQQNLP